MRTKAISSVIVVLASLSLSGVAAGPAETRSWLREAEPNDYPSQADIVRPSLWRFGTIQGYYDCDWFARRGNVRVTVTNTGYSPIGVYFPDPGVGYRVFPAQPHVREDGFHVKTLDGRPAGTAAVSVSTPAPVPWTARDHSFSRRGAGTGRCAAPR